MENQVSASAPNSPRSKGLDEKFCESCGEIIKIKAEICPKCGVRQKQPFNKTVLVLLTFFLGGLGIHKFYLGKTVQGIFYFLFCWTFIPSIIAFIESVIYICTSSEKLQEKYPKVKSSGGALALIIIIAGIGLVFIVGLLSALAIPSFMEASTKAKVSEIPTLLTAIYNAENEYKKENGEFSDDLSKVALIPGKTWFSYSIDNVSSNTFVAHAVAKNQIGSIKVGEEATIDQAGEKTISSHLLKYLPSWE